MDGEHDDRVARLEERVARLEAAAAQSAGEAAGESLALAARAPAEAPATDADAFWALRGLQARVGEPGAVVFAGSVHLPGGGRVEWQEGRLASQLLDDDWSQSAAGLTALAHPVRLLLLREILLGAETVAALGELPSLGTSGQLYHHLRQLVSAGWLRSSARGQYHVPAERVVPLLAILAAARG
ncbi:MAG TPA: ArsR family transcriptional regulator [Streptosporangiaceae bacterium]